MNATTDRRVLIDTLKFNDDVLNVSMTGMTDELAYRRLRHGGPSIAWNIGHMLHHRNQIAAAVSCSGPAVDLERFKTAATDGHDLALAAIASLRRRRSRTASVGAVANARSRCRCAISKLPARRCRSPRTASHNYEPASQAGTTRASSTARAASGPCPSAMATARFIVWRGEGSMRSNIA